MVSRAGTRRCYISLLCVGVGGKKQRKISSESERERLRKICASSRTPPSPPRTTEFEEKDSREMRALLLCVAVHKKALLLYKGKKSTFTTTKEKAHVRRKRKRATPPNTVTQTVHHERAFKSILRERERQRERQSVERALAPRYSRFKEETNSTFFSRKKVTKKDAERRAFSSLFSTRFERCITHTKHTHALVNEHKH